MPSRTSRPRRHVAVIALTALVGTIVPVALSGTASAAPGSIDAKRAEAKRLESEIAQNGDRISQLDEDYNQARIKVDEAAAAIDAAQSEADAARDHADELRSEVQSRAAELYMGVGNSSPLPEFDANDVREIGSRSRYTAIAAEEHEQLINELTVAQEQLAEQVGQLEDAKAAAAAEQETIDARRGEIEAAQAHQRDLLSSVKGDIAQLVREEQQRRAAAEEAAARAAMASVPASTPTADTGTASSDSTQSSPTPAPEPSAPAPAPEPVATPPAASSAAQVAVDTAYAQLGDPYVYAAAGPDSFDCSGLTMYAWAAAGVSLPHSSAAQYAALPHVAQDQLSPGDLVFYGSPIHHVGIYVGGGSYIHAPQTGDVVKISSIYRSDWAGAARPG